MPRGSYQGRRFYVEGKDRVVLCAVAGLFILLFLRLFSLQVIKGEYYLALAEENRIRIVPIEPPRGLIYDRNGILLVDNYPSYTVSVLPYELANVEESLRKLHDLLNCDVVDIVAKIKAKGFGLEPVKVKRDASFEIVSYVEENRLDLPGVICQVEPKRRYVYGRTASHILGYTGEISEKELRTYRDRGYLCGWAIGKDGLERSYEEDLKGSNGFKYLEVNARGREIGLLPGKDPLLPGSGKNLHLTIDIRLQLFAEKVFPEGLTGSLVATNPQTGEILALVSKPTFDPNLFSSVLAPDDWIALNSDPQHPLLNRAIGASYPPGSTLKIVTAAAGLETKTVSVNSLLRSCTGEMQFGNRIFHCWVEEGHGSLNLRGAITQSCDVYFYQLGRRVGLDVWAKYAKAFYFGQPAGIDLQGEEGGLVPTSDYYDRRYGKKKWSQNLILNVAVGQGELLVTPLQLAVFAGVIGTEGIWYQPHVVKEIELEETGTFLKKTTVSKHIPDVSKETYTVLKQAMVDVVNSGVGTARGAAIEGVRVAGKTGTAQNPHGEDHALFICFAPAEDPVIALAVIVENGGKGGSVAAPLARRILQAYLFDEYEEVFAYGESSTEKY